MHVAEIVGEPAYDYLMGVAEAEFFPNATQWGHLYCGLLSIASLISCEPQ